MPIFNVRTVNSVFASDVIQIEATCVEQARRFGIRGAMVIAGDEVENGAKVVGVEVIVTDEAGVERDRSTVSLSIASLLCRCQSGDAFMPIAAAAAAARS